MGRLRGGGIYGMRAIADALGVDPRELAAMIRADEVPQRRLGEGARCGKEAEEA